MAVEPPLTEDERTVLEILMEPDRRVVLKTDRAIAIDSGLELKQVRAALRSLSEREPYLVHWQPDISIEEGVWFSSHHAADAMEGES